MWAFGHCANLTSMTIPESVTEFGKFVFRGSCGDLVIYGKNGSAAEVYAEENEIQFQDPDVTVEAAPKDTYSNEGADAEP